MLDADRVLLQHGDSLIFEDEPHLRAFLEFVFSAQSPWVPPGRNNGRTTAHRERYCLRYFLAQEAAKFAYPVAVEKTERPDFVITDGAGKRIGVEHSDAGPEAYQRWLAHMEGQIDENDDGEAVASPQEVPGEHSVEQAATDIVSVLVHKSGSINKAGYQDADEYVLIVYVLSHAPLFFSGDIEEIFDHLPDFTSVRAEDQDDGDQDDGDQDDADRRDGGRTFDRALIIVNGRARYWR